MCWSVMARRGLQIRNMGRSPVETQLEQSGGYRPGRNQHCGMSLIPQLDDLINDLTHGALIETTLARSQA